MTALSSPTSHNAGPATRLPVPASQMPEASSTLNEEGCFARATACFKNALESLPFCKKTEESEQHHAEETEEATATREPNCVSKFFSEANNAVSFAALIVDNTTNFRNEKLHASLRDNAGITTKGAYVATWIVSEALFIAAIPLVAIEAVAKLAIRAVLYVLSGQTFVGTKTLTEWYNKFSSNQIQLHVGIIAWSQAFANLSAKTYLVRNEKIVLDSSIAQMYQFACNPKEFVQQNSARTSRAAKT